MKSVLVILKGNWYWKLKLPNIEWKYAQNITDRDLTRVNDFLEGSSNKFLLGVCMDPIATFR